MKLLYLYANDGHFFSDFEVNFSKRLQFSVVKTANEYRIDCHVDDSFKPLPPRFFSVSPNNYSDVSEVSFLTGRNGAGKTTIARLIQDLFNGGRSDCDIIMVYSTGINDQELLEARATFDYVEILGVDGTQSSKCLVRGDLPPGLKWVRTSEVDAAAVVNDIEMVYFSPSLSLGTSLSNTTDVVINLSAGARFFKNSERYFNTLFAAQDAYLQSAGYVAEEFRNILEFIRDFYALPSERRIGFPLPVPQRVVVTYNRSMERLLRNWVKTLKGGRVGEYKELYKKVLLLIDEKDLFSSSFAIYVLNYCRDLDASNERHENVYGTYARAMLNFCSILGRQNEACKGKSRRTRIINFLRCTIRNAREVIQKECEAAVRLFELLDEAISKLQDERELWKGYLEFPIVRESNDDVACNQASDSSGYSKAFDVLLDGDQFIMRLLTLHRKAVLITDFLTFDISPRMSSGETAYLCMLSGFNWWANRKGKECSLRNFASSMHEVARRARRDVLIYLDEAETSLHPELQLHLLWVFIWFVENMTKALDVHLVFASHSPLLLSDVPLSNVTFLERRGEGENAKLTVRDSMEENGVTLRNTFAAHIFDLYALPFYLSRGTIGRFASEKINNVIKALEAYALDGDYRTIVELIGDDFIRSYLERLTEDSKSDSIVGE